VAVVESRRWSFSAWMSHFTASASVASDSSHSRLS
jgi:hypothetical protein